MKFQPARTNEQKSMAVYIILAFGITWLCWIPALVIAGQQGYLLPTMANFAQLSATGFTNGQHVFLSILFSLAVYGPLTGALVATAMRSGKAGLADLLARMIHWRVGAKWYALTIGIPLVISLVPWLVGTLTGNLQVPAVAVTLPVALGFLVWQLLTSGLGEEPGWRGFLLPTLLARQGSDKTVWTLGILWAVWHYPFTVYVTLSNIVDTPLIGVLITVVMALLGQTISLVGITYLYLWLYNNTKSVWIAILFHALTNFIPQIILAGLNPSLGILTAIMPWVLVFVLERVYGKAHFPGVVETTPSANS